MHDLRRTAARNLERALTGHKTEAVYRRCAIVAEADLFEAVRRLERSSSTEMGFQSGTERDRGAISDVASNAENSL